VDGPVSAPHSVFGHHIHLSRNALYGS